MRRSTTILSNSAAETQNWGTEFGRELKKNSVIAFFGPLGAGKTTLIQAIVEGITQGEKITISSPTFVYLNEYPLKEITLFHFDLYRLGSASEFIECGFEEYFFSEGICFIEWAERIVELLPKNCIQVHINPVNQTTREITIKDYKP